MRHEAQLILDAMRSDPKKVWLSSEIEEITGLDARKVGSTIHYHLRHKYVKSLGKTNIDAEGLRIPHTLNQFVLMGIS